MRDTGQQDIEELSKSKTRVGMVWFKFLIILTISGVPINCNGNKKDINILGIKVCHIILCCEVLGK